ncbi:MAG: hypothetical protein GY850_13215, partial [bacterium]|nr:hypothetical protein [bacterium]
KLHDDKAKLKIKAVRTTDEVYLLCRSDAKAAKGTEIFERKTKKFEEALTIIKEALGKLYLRALPGDYQASSSIAGFPSRAGLVSGFFSSSPCFSSSFLPKILRDIAVALD